MQRREKILAVVLLAAIVLWQGWPMVRRAIVEPIKLRQAELESLNESIAKGQDEQVRLARAERQLKDGKARSLPPDPLVAQRVYQAWLTDLAQEAGFGKLKVVPERRISRNEVYTTVEVSVSGTATLDQVCRFLYDYYRTGLMHRVTNLVLQSPPDKEDPLLKVSLTAEGLAMVDAPARNRLFPQTSLAAALAASGDHLTVTEPIKLPPAGTFLVRVGNEYLSVVAVAGTEWSLQRGVHGSVRASHTAGSAISIVPLNVDAETRTRSAYRAVVARNPFAVPAVETAPTDVAQPEPPPLDAAEFTYLVGVIARGDHRRALLFDRLSNQRSEVVEGKTFSIAHIEGTVRQIESDHIVLDCNGQTWRLDVGQHLRAMQPIDDAP